MYHFTTIMLAVFTSRANQANRIARVRSAVSFVTALLLVAVLAGSAVGTAVAGTPLTVMMRPDSGVTVRVEQLFKDLPPMGYAPLRVSIKNKTAYTQNWSMTSAHSASGYGQDGRTIRGTFTFSVESGRDGEFLVLAPLLPRADAGQVSYGSNPNLNISMSGYGMEGMSDRWNNTGRPGSPTGSGYNRRAELPFILVSEKYVVKGWHDLATGIPNMDGTSVEKADWPTDYRAYMGVYAAFIAREEWMSLQADQRQAILQWVMQGGHLYICWPEASEAGLASMSTLTNRTPGGTLGAGSIRPIVAGETLPAKEIRSKCLQPGQDPRYWGAEKIGTTSPYGSSNNEDEDRAITREFHPLVKFGPSEGMEPPQIPRGLILLFVLGFSVLVGPVNLFYLAPVNRRYRLFWTTPLISVAASVFLMALIFLSEGIGGAGNRVLATLLVGDERKSMAFTIQEQASRTAVLFYPSFTVPGISTVQAVRLNNNKSDDDDSSGSRYGRGGGSSPVDQMFYVAGNTYSGAWFMGRSLQAQWLQTMEDSRAQITLMNVPESAEGKPPVLLSQLSPTLETVFFRDRKGSVWKCTSLGSGQKKTCEASDEKELKSFLSEAKDKFGRRLRALCVDTEGNRGWFYAIAAPDYAQPVETLSGIRWTTTGHYYLGQVVGAAPLPATASTTPTPTTTPAATGTPGAAGAQEGNR